MRDKYKEALQKIAAGRGWYGAQAYEYKQIAREALGITDENIDSFSSSSCERANAR